jgi:hypothetical protein
MLNALADSGGQGWIGDKPCLVTINIRASVTIARPSITSGFPERKPNQCYILQMASGETLLILKETLIWSLGLFII